MPERTGSAGLPRPAERIAFLDAWRFFAVAGVILCHIIARMVARGAVPADSWIGQAARLGPLGVNIFFFISGYVICLGLVREQQRTGTVDLRAFYLRRAFRILPPLAIYLAALAALGPCLQLIDITPSQLLRSALFVCNFHRSGDDCSWWAGHTWSLGFEEQFYIVFPLLFVRLGMGRKISGTSWVPWTALLLLSCSGILVRAFTQGFPVYYAANAAFLATGCCAALLEPRTRAVPLKVSAPAWSLLLLCALCLFILFPARFYHALQLVMPLPLLFFVLNTPLQQPSVRRIFENPTVGHLGRISYTVYLWQQLALGEWPAVPTAVIPLLIVPVFCWAAWSWRFIEHPLIRIGREMSARLTAVKHAAKG